MPSARCLRLGCFLALILLGASPHQGYESETLPEIQHPARETIPMKATMRQSAPRPAQACPSVQHLEKIVRKNAHKHGVDEKLVWAVMRQESDFNSRAVSPKGAMGLMQLMPGTAAMLGVTDPFNAEQNVAGGVKYLRTCLDYFDQDIDLALAAYNAGPANVTKYQGVPPFAETINYVAAVIKDCYARVRPKGVPASQVAESGATQVSGLNWRLPVPRWRISLPQAKLDGPRWKGTAMPGATDGQNLVLGKRTQSPKAPACGRKVSSL